MHIILHYQPISPILFHCILLLEFFQIYGFLIYGVRIADFFETGKGQFEVKLYKYTRYLNYHFMIIERRSENLLLGQILGHSIFLIISVVLVGLSGRFWFKAERRQLLRSGQRAILRLIGFVLTLLILLFPIPMLGLFF